MLVPILLLALPLVAQEPERSSSNSEFHLHPDDPLHRFVELELTAGGATIDWTSGFDGTLHVWAQSRALDPVLAVTVAGADAVADDDSGGGTTAYVQVVVASGQVVTLAVQAIERHGGSTTVHWVASPETDETRAAVERAKDLLSEAETAEGSQNHERARALVSQAVGVLRDARGAKASHAATQLAWQGGFAAYRLGAIAACSEAWALALAARERTLPEDHPDLLRARQNRAATIWQQGDLAGARALEERVLATRERTLPEDHPDLLAARLNLAATMKEQGDLAGARTLFERVLEAYERALPADHPDLLAARQNLAATMGKQGDLGGARALEERVLEAYERALPTDHPDLLRARQNLAVTMKEQGDLGGARALFERVLEAYERTLPEDHPDLLRARQNLAVTMRKQGDLAGARALAERVLRAFERTLPKDNPDLLRARQNLAVTIQQQGDLAGAHALFERVLEASERTLPEGHPDLLRAQQNLAVTMREQGDLAGARALEERVLETRQRTLPEDHPDLLRARQNLAVTMKEQGDLGGARALEERVLEARERALPEDHPDLLRARLNLAVTMRRQGDLGGARAIEERVVEARERTLSEDHPSLLLARQNLAVTMLVQGDLSGARALFERVLEAYERTLPDDHPDLNAVRLNLAITISQQGDLAGASALFERVLDAYERTLPADHPDVLRARLNLAVTMKKQGDLGGARALVERVLETYERTLPADHPELLRARQNLAVTIWQQGDLAGARALYERVLEANERTLPEDHPDLLHARLNVAVTMWQQGDLAGARALFERVLDAYERTLPVDHPDLLRARQNLAITRKEQGDLTGVHTLASDLAAGMIAGLESAAASLSDREARELVGDYAQRHSMVRFFSDPPSSARLRFDLAETLRDVGGAEARRDASQDPALDSLRGEIAQVRAELGDLLSIASDNATAGDVATSIEALTKQRDELQRKLRSELKNRGVRIGAIRSVEVARALPPGAVALGFVRVHDEVAHFADERVCRGDIVAAHFLRPNGAIVDVELGAASELEELVERWRSELGAPVRGIGRTKGDLDPEKRAGEALRERLLDPLLAELGDETTTLLVCAADLVHLVPLDALPLGDGRVGDRFRIVNQRSFRRLVSPRRELAASGEAQLLALGGAAFDAEGAQPAKPTEALSAAIEASERGSGAPARFEPLFFTGAEAERVKLLFEAAEMGASLVLTGEGATKAAFHEHAPGKRFVHVATHGWFAEMELDEPEEDELPSMRWGLDERVRAFSPLSYCGLAFAGANRGRDSLGRVPGIMTAEELAGVDLSACELAVLSACETNVGLRSAGMGIESLQSALHAAGARTAITSLWKVDDSATRKLMELFYTYLWVEKLPKAEALWRAKRDLRAAGAPLRHWAAWVLSGDPD